MITLSGEECVARAKFTTAGDAWLGRFGEAFWSRVFADSDLQFVPLCRIEDNGAPAIRGGPKKIVLPDFDVAGDGRTAYIDSKVKTQSIVFRKANSERHGIDRCHYQAYLAAGAAYRKDTGLALVECFRESDGVRWSGSLLVERFANLDQPIDGFSNQEHMVYWPRKRFVDLDELTAVDLLAVANGKAHRSYSVELRKVFFPDPPLTQLTLI